MYSCELKGEKEAKLATEEENAVTKVLMKIVKTMFVHWMESYTDRKLCLYIGWRAIQTENYVYTLGGEL